jgi:AraC-like DNA-binding protein
MSIFYLEEHKVCGNYISDFNIGFQYYNVPKGEHFIPANKDYNCLFFLIRGKAMLHYDTLEYNLKKGGMCFIPISSEYEFIAETDIAIVVNYFDKPVDLCEKMALESLSSFLENKQHIPTLKIHPALKRFLTSMILYISDGIDCKHFHEVKHKELLFILRYFYTKKDIAHLFAPIISNNLDFKNVVLSNYIRANSIKELANICNYSLSSFNRLFKRNFKDSPYIWLQNQKLKYIVNKLSDKNVPLGQIIYEFGFSSPSHFTIFCKRHLHTTPSQFRKEHLK